MAARVGNVTPPTLMMRFRSWLAGWLFALAGKLDESYDVWLDEAPRKKPGESDEWPNDAWPNDEDDE